MDEIKPNIKLVINNAGFDRAGNFRNMENKDIYSIIDINTIGMSMISKCCLPYMYKGSFQIIVGPEGAYLPLPMRAVYGASKTYGRFFARALREEERNRGINILFMGTGAMNTEMFRSNASSDDVSNTKFLDLNKITVTALNRAEKMLLYIHLVYTQKRQDYWVKYFRVQYLLNSQIYLILYLKIINLKGNIV